MSWPEREREMPESIDFVVSRIERVMSGVTDYVALEQNNEDIIALIADWRRLKGPARAEEERK